MHCRKKGDEGLFLMGAIPSFRRQRLQPAQNGLRSSRLIAFFLSSVELKTIHTHPLLCNIEGPWEGGRVKKIGPSRPRKESNPTQKRPVWRYPVPSMQAVVSHHIPLSLPVGYSSRAEQSASGHPVAHNKCDPG